MGVFLLGGLGVGDVRYGEYKACYKLGHLRENEKIGVCAAFDCSNVFTGWDDRSFRKFCLFVISTAACTESISEFEG